MTTLLPDALRLAWWGTAWLRGHIVTDEMVDAVIGDQATHLIAEDDLVHPLAIGMGRLRAAGATGFGAAFPAEGDPVGLGGPRAFNDDALEAGSAVIALEAGLGLVPERVGGATTWYVLPAEPRQLDDVGATDRLLREAITRSAGALADLDVARWRPEVADLFMNLHRHDTIQAPAGVPPRCADLAARALRARDIVDLALDDDGSSITVAEGQQRREALVPLARAARRALTAAGSPEVWPPL